MENKDSALLMKMYHMLLMLKDEVSKLTLQVKALRKEIKGVSGDGEEF